MNKKIILAVVVLLIVAIVFVACKGKTDVEEPTESTKETVSDIVLRDPSNDDSQPLVPELYDPDSSDDEGDILYFGDEEDSTGDDSISWDELVGN